MILSNKLDPGVSCVCPQAVMISNDNVTWTSRVRLPLRSHQDSCWTCNMTSFVVLCHLQVSISAMPTAGKQPERSISYLPLR